MIEIQDRTILITGADGGIGTALLEEFIKRGVKKVYATGLNLDRLLILERNFPSHVVPIVLDVTNMESIKSCTEKAHDTNMLINNAGVELKIPIIADKAADAALFEMKVNYIGVINMINSFLPHLYINKNSCIINILSMGSLAIVKRLATYCASKAATHVLTETVREELREKNIKVIGVYPGYVNTAMVPEEVKTKKTEPKDLAQEILQGIINGEDRIFPDEISQSYSKNNPIRTQYFD